MSKKPKSNNVRPWPSDIFEHLPAARFEMNGHIYCMISADRIVFDEEINRDVSQSKVNHIAADGVFDPDAVSPVVLYYIGNGLFLCIDGQHRVLVLRMRAAHGVLAQVPARIVNLADKQAAAKLIATLNTVNPIKSLNRFRALLYSGDYRCTFVRDELAVIGVNLRTDKGNLLPNETRAAPMFVEALEKLDPPRFRFLVRILKKAYCRPPSDGVIEPDALRSDFVFGLYNAIRTMTVNRNQMLLGLRRGATAAKIMENALKTNGTGSGGGRKMRAKHEIVNAMNAGLVARATDCDVDDDDDE